MLIYYCAEKINILVPILPKVKYFKFINRTFRKMAVQEPNRPKLFNLSSENIWKTEVKNETDSWKGTVMSEMYLDNDPWKYFVAPLESSKQNTVLFHQSVNLQSPPEPKRSQITNLWDDQHVKMPFSDKNMYEERIVSLLKMRRKTILKSKWELIKSTLERPITSSIELEDAILAYTQHPVKLVALHYFFNKHLQKDETAYFFNTLLPQIIKLALQLPEIILSPIPLLEKNKMQSLSLSQLQIASLVANIFLCTFPKSAPNYPDVSFLPFFDEHVDYIYDKLRCMLNYFYRICNRPPLGVVTFERKFIPTENLPNWENLDVAFINTKLHITTTGNIQDDGLGLLQVDFANKFIGGKVLTPSVTQEEVMFVTSPELYVTRLFTEVLGPTEALLISGAERFNKCSNNSRQFKWYGSFEDQTPFDDYRRRKTNIIAIDAQPTTRYGQYKIANIIRELNKVYVGFYGEMQTSSQLQAVATGKWGCGAFGGNIQLKSLLQIMACAAVGRSIVYYAFSDNRTRDEINDIHIFLQNQNITIGQLFTDLKMYEEGENYDIPLYTFIKSKHLKT